MKAFSFRLERVLRWREAQVSLQKPRVAAAMAQVSGTQAALDGLRADLAGGAEEIARQPTGIALASYAAFAQRSRLRIHQTEERLAAARRGLSAETEKLTEANRRVHVLAKLEADGREGWQKEFERELGVFADEAFLIGLQSKKRTGA